MTVQTNSGVKMETRRRVGRLGWAIILGFSLLLFLLPSNYTPNGLTPEMWLLLIVAILFLFVVGLFLGVVLLLIGYFPFFQQMKGLLVFVALFMIGLRLFSYLRPFTDLGWPVSHLRLLWMLWLLVIIGGLPLVLGIYLWYQDRAVRLVAITFPSVTWLLIAYVRWHGPEQMILDMFQGVFPAELMVMICFTQFVFVLAPLFFIGHSLRLVYREWTRADMLLLTDHRLDPVPEETP